MISQTALVASLGYVAETRSWPPDPRFGILSTAVCFENQFL